MDSKIDCVKHLKESLEFQSFEIRGLVATNDMMVDALVKTGGVPVEKLMGDLTLTAERTVSIKRDISRLERKVPVYERINEQMEFLINNMYKLVKDNDDEAEAEAETSLPIPDGKAEAEKESEAGANKLLACIAEERSKVEKLSVRLAELGEDVYELLYTEIPGEEEENKVSQESEELEDDAAVPEESNEDENSDSDTARTVEQLLDCISNRELADDQRNAMVELMNLIAYSSDAYIVFLAKGLSLVMSVLKEERDNGELVRSALGVLNNAMLNRIPSDSQNEEARTALTNVDMLSRDADSISLLLSYLGLDDFYKDDPFRILNGLVENFPNSLPETLLAIPNCMTRLVEMLMDDNVEFHLPKFLTLLIRQSEEILKVVVSEDGVYKTERILRNQGPEDSRLVEESLKLLNSLLYTNPANQALEIKFMAAVTDSASEPLMQRTVNHLVLSSLVEIKAGEPSKSVKSYFRPIVLKLLAIWFADCPDAVWYFLHSPPSLAYLLELLADESELACTKGLAALILGQCVIFNESLEGLDAFAVVRFVTQKVGLTSYFLKLDEMQNGKNGDDPILSSIFDSNFVTLVHNLEADIKGKIVELSSQPKSDEPVVPAELEQESDETEAEYINRLKESVAKQCTEIKDLLARNAVMAKELASSDGVLPETLVQDLREKSQELRRLKLERDRAEFDVAAIREFSDELESALNKINASFDGFMTYQIKPSEFPNIDELKANARTNNLSAWLGREKSGVEKLTARLSELGQDVEKSA